MLRYGLPAGILQLAGDLLHRRAALVAQLAVLLGDARLMHRDGIDPARRSGLRANDDVALRQDVAGPSGPGHDLAALPLLIRVQRPHPRAALRAVVGIRPQPHAAPRASLHPPASGNMPDSRRTIRSSGSARVVPAADSRTAPRARMDVRAGRVSPAHLVPAVASHPRQVTFRCRCTRSPACVKSARMSAWPWTR